MIWDKHELSVVIGGFFWTLQHGADSGEDCDLSLTSPYPSARECRCSRNQKLSCCAKQPLEMFSSEPPFRT